MNIMLSILAVFVLYPFIFCPFYSLIIADMLHTVATGLQVTRRWNHWKWNLTTWDRI